eukprot:m.127389 g.127389  ORF g.127389 m.127389 type:complete len:293 (+) comp13008_c0_seq1:1978-2856(+)
MTLLPSIRKSLFGLQRVQRGVSMTLRAASSSSANIEVSELRPGVKIVSLNRKPVNSLTMGFMKEIIDTVKTLENDGDTKAMILSSSIPTIFSGGLHVPEIYNKPREYMVEFYSTLQEIWLTLNNTPLVTAAAIEGHCPAGGCVLALCCDERVMTKGKYLIGLNETQLGIVPPAWVIGSYRAAIGQRMSDRLIQQGRLVDPQTAYNLGMIDELVESGEAIAAADKLITPYLNVNAGSRHFTKRLSREHYVSILEGNRQGDIDRFVGVLATDEIQAILKAFIDNLETRKQKKEK